MKLKKKNLCGTFLMLLSHVFQFVQALSSYTKFNQSCQALHILLSFINSIKPPFVNSTKKETKFSKCAPVMPTQTCRLCYGSAFPWTKGPFHCVTQRMALSYFRIVLCFSYFLFISLYVSGFPSSSNLSSCPDAK